MSQFWDELGEGIATMLILIGIGFCILSIGTCGALVGGYIKIGDQTKQYENATNPITDN